MTGTEAQDSADTTRVGQQIDNAFTIHPRKRATQPSNLEPSLVLHLRDNRSNLILMRSNRDLTGAISRNPGDEIAALIATQSQPEPSEMRLQQIINVIFHAARRMPHHQSFNQLKQFVVR